MKNLFLIILFLSVPAIVIAAPPGTATYDDYAATGGVITANCPSGFTCGAAMSEDGFYQRSISDGTNTYFQTIVIEEGATTLDPTTLTFRDENYVMFGSPTGGIADQMVINDNVDPTDTFAGTTKLDTGWACLQVAELFWI